MKDPSHRALYCRAKDESSALLPCLVRPKRALGELRLGQFDQLGEIFLLTHGEVGQNLTVQSHASLSQAKHQLGIGQAVFAGASVDAQDPQLAE